MHHILLSLNINFSWLEKNSPAFSCLTVHFSANPRGVLNSFIHKRTRHPSVYQKNYNTKFPRGFSLNQKCMNSENSDKSCQRNSEWNKQNKKLNHTCGEVEVFWICTIGKAKCAVSTESNNRTEKKKCLRLDTENWKQTRK